MIDLIVCSVCLRVRDGSEWLDAEHVIGETRSYEGELPRLHGALCDDCAGDARRRSRGDALSVSSFASVDTGVDQAKTAISSSDFLLSAGTTASRAA
jgi:hypothetical protein